MHSPRHMISKNRIILPGIKLGLRQFQALEIFSMLQIEVDMQSGGILADKMRYEKVRYQIFEKCVVNLIRCFNI